MVGGKNKNKVRSVPVTPEQHQEVGFEEEGKVDKTSEHTQHPPGSSRCGIGSDSVSGDSISSESVVPVYSGECLALCVVESDINLEHDPQFRHRVEWRREKN
jgi:hypothetical protein